MKEKKNSIIVQARMTSTRLPGKVLTEICRKPLISYVLERLKRCRKTTEIILAIPDTKGNDVLEEYARKHELRYFRGSENDVLSRYYYAAKEFRVENIVRVTADCPFVDPRIVDLLVDTFIDKKVDYAAVGIEGNFPRGLDAEMFGFETLERVNFEAHRDYEREHVTPHIYENPDLFKVLFLEASGKLRKPDLRLTVDTAEDLKLAREILERFVDRGMFYAEDVIDLLEADPGLASINASVKQKKLGE